ncbi:MAG: sigma-70 family RNA polymerase sigma factor, partial [FCB group bacterium]|nr:sigma-70 family RNA polymerase sigma factor [FCB group bacterium]
MSTADQVLFERWSRSRDAEAFTELTRRYAGMVHASCLRVLQNRSDAEDATLECFEKLATLHRGPQGHMGAWLHRMAVNAALDRLRSDRRRKEREQRYSDAQPHNAEPMWDDLYEHVDEAIAALPDNLRGPIVAHFLDNETHAAIAEREGVTRSAITQRIDRGIEALRDNLRKRGVIVGGAALAAMLAENAKAEPLPAALSQALAKLALSGVPGAAVAASATVAWWLAAGAIAAVAIVAVSAFTALRKEQPAPPSVPMSAASAPAEEMSPVAPAQNHAMSEPPLPSVEASGLGNRILGRAYDKETGQGVAGVALQSRLGCKGNHEYPNTTSDEEGRYELVLPCDGLWAVDVEAPLPYAWASPATVYTTEGRATAGVDFALERGHRVAGRVVDAAGRPLAGADVEGHGDNEAGFDVKSKADGTFEAAQALPARNVCFTAYLDREGHPRIESLRYGPYDVPVPGLEGLTLVLYEPASVSGRILDPQGQPVAGVNAMAVIDAYSGAADPKLSPQRREFGGEDSDEDGRYEIALSTPGSYHLGVLGSSSMPVLARVEVKPGDRLTGIDLCIPADQAVH